MTTINNKIFGNQASIQHNKDIRITNPNSSIELFSKINDDTFLDHFELVAEAQRLISSADKSQSNWKKILIEQVMSSNKYCMTTKINICNEIRKYNDEK